MSQLYDAVSFISEDGDAEWH
jgi:hypothetical protein